MIYWQYSRKDCLIPWCNHIITIEAAFDDVFKAYTIPKRNEFSFTLCVMKIHRFCLHFSHCLVYGISSKIKLNIRQSFKDDDSVPVLVVSDIEAKSFVKGFHEYKHLWKPILIEKLATAMEPVNAVNEYSRAFASRGKQKF